MAMQDDYKSSVTTREEQKCKSMLTYHSGLSCYHLSKTVEFLHGYKSLVVVLPAHKQLDQQSDFTQAYLRLLDHWVVLQMLHWKWRYIQVFG